MPSTLGRRVIFLNLGLFSSLVFLRRGIFYTFMINYLFSLMGSVTSTTLLGTMNMMASALGQNLLWGKISDRYELRSKLIIIGESTAAVAYLLVFLVHRSLLNAQANFAAGLSLVVGFSILEFFWSMSDVGWATLLADVTTNKTRGGVVGALNFAGSTGRIIGIGAAGFLYNDGEGFRQGTLFFLVIAILLTSAAMMWMTLRYAEKRYIKTENNNMANALKKKTANGNEAAGDNDDVYRWFLIALVVIVIGAACVTQVFQLFIRLPEGLNASGPEMSLILTAWNAGGMLANLFCWSCASRIGNVRVLLTGLALAITTPLFFGSTPDVLTMALIYGINGISFWIIQTAGFAFAGDIIPEDRRGRLFSRYNTVMALSWGAAGFLVGGPLADVQTHNFGIPSWNAYVNTFYASSIILLIGSALFIVKAARLKTKIS